MSDKATQDFWDAFTCAGSLVTECVCGRTHFSTQESAGTWEDGELERLKELAVSHPDRYIPTDDDAASVAFMDGVPVCYGCPCGTAAKYEKFIVANETAILTYFRRIAKRKREQAASTESILNELY